MKSETKVINKFRREYLQECAIDHEYEMYLTAWTVYHQTADQIDGHIKNPRNVAELTLVRMAAKAATKAQEEYMYMQTGLPCIGSDIKKSRKWHDAKLEAIRRFSK